MNASGSTLIESLNNPHCYPHAVREISLIETHLSWIILTGHVAYKIKKPVNLGFVDFTTLEKRHMACLEELRLNRRLVPALYMGLQPICGSFNKPLLTQCDAPIEYAVKMRQFDNELQFDRLISKGLLMPDHIRRFADRLADFFDNILRADIFSPYGTNETILQPMLDNIELLKQVLRDAKTHSWLCALTRWVETQHQSLDDVLKARKQDGFIRECHGDLHLGNIALIDNEPVAFDCLEFSAELRWIDLMSEIAFLVMDLDDHGRSDLGRIFLARLLEHTGDYNGLTLLRFYAVYRALVRAKVMAIRLSQSDPNIKNKMRLRKICISYIHLAQQYTAAPRPAMVITCGLSGSGKTTLTEQLLAIHPFVRIRSDIERKRLHGLSATQRNAASIYTTRSTGRTYERLLALSRTVIEAGFAVLVDAANLKHMNRMAFANLAHELGVPFAILYLVADEATLSARIRNRTTRGDDASDATVEVLHQQITQIQPPSADTDENTYTIHVDTASDIDANEILTRLLAYLNI